MSDIRDDFNSGSIPIEDSILQAKMQDIITNIELLKSDFLESIKEESLEDITQQQYCSFLMHCQLFFFRPTKCLYKYTPNTQHNGQQVLMYNDLLLLLLCEYYIYMSMRYNKIANVYGFSLLTGITDDTLIKWGQQENQRPEAFEVVKRLRKTYETSLENGAQSGKNPVGFIATLNHRFGWNADNKPTLTVNITRSKNEILSTYNQNLIDETSGNGV